MKHAGADWIGLLIFVGVVIFQVISHFIDGARKKDALKPQDRPAQKPRPAQPKKEDWDTYSDPLDELMEALGKKPGQAPSQLPQPPQQTIPSRPIPPLTPAAPMPGREFRKTPPTPAKPVIEESYEGPSPSHKSLAESAPTMVITSGHSAREDAKEAQKASERSYTTRLDSPPQHSPQAPAVDIHGLGTPIEAQNQHAYHLAEKNPLPSEWLTRLRKPEEIRRAIVAKEILDAPVALR